jgi:hypothetical protein
LRNEVRERSEGLASKNAVFDTGGRIKARVSVDETVKEEKQESDCWEHWQQTAGFQQ